MDGPKVKEYEKLCSTDGDIIFHIALHKNYVSHLNMYTKVWGGAGEDLHGSGSFSRVLDKNAHLWA